MEITPVPEELLAVVSRRIFASGVLGLLASTALPLMLAAQGQPQDQPQYPTPEEVIAAWNSPLFTSHETLRLTLTADFNTLRRKDQSGRDSEERPARIEWVKADGSTEVHEIQIQTRVP